MVAFDTAKRRTSIEIQSIATSQCTQTLPRSLPLRPRRISRSLSPSKDDRLRRQDSETNFATGAIKPIFPTARRTACVKLLQLDWRNVARRLTKSWPSQAISHSKKWSATPALRERLNLRTPLCPSSNDEHKVSHSPARWDN